MTPGIARYNVSGMKICSHPPCTEKSAAKDLCRRHYYQQRAGRALTMPTRGDTRAESDRLSAQMKKQDSRCACCREIRIGVRLHLRGELVLCDICMGVLQFTEKPDLLETIAAFARAQPMSFDERPGPHAPDPDNVPPPRKPKKQRADDAPKKKGKKKKAKKRRS